MNTCGHPIAETLAGILRCAQGHQFRARKEVPHLMTAVDPEHPDDPDHDGKIYPMGEVCPHPNYFDPDDEPTAVI